MAHRYLTHLLHWVRYRVTWTIQELKWCCNRLARMSHSNKFWPSHTYMYIPLIWHRPRQLALQNTNSTLSQYNVAIEVILYFQSTLCWAARGTLPPRRLGFFYLNLHRLGHRGDTPSKKIRLVLLELTPGWSPRGHSLCQYEWATVGFSTVPDRHIFAICTYCVFVDFSRRNLYNISEAPKEGVQIYGQINSAIKMQCWAY